MKRGNTFIYMDTKHAEKTLKQASKAGIVFQPQNQSPKCLRYISYPLIETHYNVHEVFKISAYKVFFPFFEFFFCFVQFEYIYIFNSKKTHF